MKIKVLVGTVNCKGLDGKPVEGAMGQIIDVDPDCAKQLIEAKVAATTDKPKVKD